MPDMTPKEVFDEMPGRFLPDKAKSISVVIQFDLSGENGGQWYVTVVDGACTTSEGAAENPKTTITMDATDFVAMISGEANGLQLFMSGKIKLKGDMMLAYAITSWFQTQ
jgi:putative sterol carrier protein